MSKIEAVVDVGENDITKVHLGDSAIVEVDAYNNRKFKGMVTQIASSIVASAQLPSTAPPPMMSPTIKYISDWIRPLIRT